MPATSHVTGPILPLHRRGPVAIASLKEPGEPDMRRAAILLILASGCSTNPVADLADWLKPARADMARGPGRGGVCQPTPATGVEPIGPGATPTVSGPPPVAGPGAGPAPDERLPPIDAPSPVR